MGYDEYIYFKILDRNTKEWDTVKTIHNSWSYNNISSHFMPNAFVRRHLRYLDIFYINEELKDREDLLESEVDELEDILQELSNIKTAYNVREEDARAYYDYRW